MSRSFVGSSRIKKFEFYKPCKRGRPKGHKPPGGLACQCMETEAHAQGMDTKIEYKSKGNK